MKDLLEGELENAEILLEAAKEADNFIEAFRYSVKIDLLKFLITESMAIKEEV